MQGDLEARIRNLEELMARYLRELRDVRELVKKGQDQLVGVRSVQQPASR